MKMNYTITEKKCHKAFVKSYLLYFVSAICLMYSSFNNILCLGLVSIITLSISWIMIGWTGFSYGWELKRISIMEESEQ